MLSSRVFSELTSVQSVFHIVASNGHMFATLEHFWSRQILEPFEFFIEHMSRSIVATYSSMLQDTCKSGSWQPFSDLLTEK